MNWLAHLLLSDPSPCFQIGNLLPDIAPRNLHPEIPQAYRPGMLRHRQIDAFTDSHPVVRASWRRFNAPCRRFAGVITDVFYDHFLARSWGTYSATGLNQFTKDFHLSLPEHQQTLPAVVYQRLERLRDEDLLNSYAHPGGIHEALRRISGRLRRPCDLTAAMGVFEACYDEFRSDFSVFFPQLMQHVMPDPAPLALSASDQHPLKVRTE